MGPVLAYDQPVNLFREQTHNSEMVRRIYLSYADVRLLLRVESPYSIGRSLKTDEEPTAI